MSQVFFLLLFFFFSGAFDVTSFLENAKKCKILYRNYCSSMSFDMLLSANNSMNSDVFPLTKKCGRMSHVPNRVCCGERGLLGPEVQGVPEEGLLAPLLGHALEEAAHGRRALGGPRTVLG